MVSLKQLKIYFNDWIDAMMKRYNGILEEWKYYKVIQAIPNPQAHFTCNDCGKCCLFEQQWCWIYPADLVGWLQELDKKDYVSLLLGVIFPAEDIKGIRGYAFPSQKAVTEEFTELIQKKSTPRAIQRTLEMILIQLKKLNWGFSEESEYCAFYNPNSEKHCSIYFHRPIQCRAYPFDSSQFIRFVIPPALRKKYQIQEINQKNFPFCPSTVFTGDPEKGVFLSEEDHDWVVIEKVNYVTSIISQDVQRSDISEMLLDLYHEKILKINSNLSPESQRK